MNDIFVYLKTIEKNFEHLKKIFIKLRKFNFKTKKKRNFAFKK